MKNSIKIVAIVGIITSFFSVYPMTEEVDYLTREIELRKTNPLLKMSQLCIWHSGRHPRKGFKVRKNDPLYTNKGLALSLTAARSFLELGKEENEKTLKTICDAVGEGTPVTSKYAVQIDGFGIFPSQNFFSIFALGEDLAKKPKKYPWTRLNRLADKKRLLIKAIFQGYRNQQKKFARIRKKLIDGVRDELKIEIPEDLMSLIVSYLPEYYTSKESRALIKEAEQKFNEEQLVNILKNVIVPNDLVVCGDTDMVGNDNDMGDVDDLMSLRPVKFIYRGKSID